MEKKALIINYKYCTGCHVCEIACRNEHEIPLDDWGIKMTEFGPKKMMDGKWFYTYVPVPSHLCDLCEHRLEFGMKPACVHHCLAQCMEVVDFAEVPARLEALGEGTGVFVPR